jgi:hypothetical protein
LDLPHFSSEVENDLTGWIFFTGLNISGADFEDIAQPIAERIIFEVRDSKHSLSGVQ